MKSTKAMVYFVGAGPGDPELITVKGARLLKEADIVVYAGSLVKKKVVEVYCREGVKAYDSAPMALEEMVRVMVDGVKAGQTVVRLHTGDPSLYGAIGEQASALEEAGVDYAMVPGVSSAFASAAALKKELTMPGVSQTVIFTRLAGRTPVPESEGLAGLSSHGATMCIFLSAAMIDKVASELKEGGYAPDTPVGVVYRASWEDERIVTGTLNDIAGKVREAAITKHAMIIVGKALGGWGPARSKLYDSGFEHGFRSQ